MSSRRRRTRDGRVALWLGLATVLCGCEAGSGDPGTSIVWDSSGVKIVESTAPRWGTEDAAWRVARDPELELGRADGPEPEVFSGITGVATLSDGSLAVGDVRTGQIRIFSHSGEHLGSGGGLGDGPGEFRGAFGFFGMWSYRGDSVVAFDRAAQKLEVFDSRGRYVRGFRLDLRLDLGRFHHLADFHHVAGPTVDGGVVVKTPPAIPSGVQREAAATTRTLLLFNATGAGPDTIVTVETQSAERRGSVFSASVEPIVSGNTIVAVTPDRFELRRYSLDGQLDAVFRRAFEARPVRREHVERERSRRLAAAPSPQMRPRIAEVFDELQVPDTFPIVRSIAADHAGNVWVEHYTLGGVTSPVWSVFDQEGLFLGDLEMPEGFLPLDIGVDHVTGVSRDEFDIPYVRRYRLLKGG